MQNFKTNQKGITLIALIITIIVMLILVGVTINVALNGGLFEKGEKAAFQTEASTVKEELEMAKALKVMNAEGKPVEDYSDITVNNLTNLDEKTQNKYTSKIVVAKNGDICYNPANVAAQEKIWLEEIGIKEYINIQKIEYFLLEKEMDETGKEIEVIASLDYTNNILKCYIGEAEGKLTLVDDEVISVDIILNYDKEFYVLENGKRIDIGTGATKIIYGYNPRLNNFIINDKFYFDQVEETEASWAPIILNFDTSRLVEE